MALSDATTQGPRAWVVRIGAPVVVLIARLAATPGECLLMLPLKLVGISHVCGGPVDIGATAGQLP
jgi:hypothetical protein